MEISRQNLSVCPSTKNRFPTPQDIVFPHLRFVISTRRNKSGDQKSSPLELCYMNSIAAKKYSTVNQITKSKKITAMEIHSHPSNPSPLSCNVSSTHAGVPNSLTTSPWTNFLDMSMITPFVSVSKSPASSSALLQYSPSPSSALLDSAL